MRSSFHLWSAVAFLLCLEIGELRFAVEQAYYKRVMNSPSPFVCW
jgi:hypothetical protein